MLTYEQAILLNHLIAEAIRRSDGEAFTNPFITIIPDGEPLPGDVLWVLPQPERGIQVVFKEGIEFNEAAQVIKDFIRVQQPDGPRTVELSNPIEQHARYIQLLFFQSHFEDRRADSRRHHFAGHESLHACRAASYVERIIQLRIAYGDPEAIALTEEDIKLMQIAVLMHDTGRFGRDGADHWDKDSGMLCEQHLLSMGVETSQAHNVAMAIVGKDDAPPKSIWQKVIHDADCLDVQRCRDPGMFDINQLDLCVDFGEQEDVQTLVKDAAALIEHHGDGYNQKDMGKKSHWETGHCYALVADDAKRLQTPFSVRVETAAAAVPSAAADAPALAPAEIVEAKDDSAAATNPLGATLTVSLPTVDMVPMIGTLTREVCDDFQRAMTPAKYQVLALMLRDFTGSDLSHIKKLETYCRSPSYSSRAMFLLDDDPTGEAPEYRLLPTELTQLASPFYMTQLITACRQEALSRNYLRVIEKFNLALDSPEANMLYQYLDHIFSAETPDPKATSGLKALLIRLRLNQHLLASEIHLDDDARSQLNEYIADYTEGRMDSTALIEQLRVHIPDSAISEAKLHSILNQFSIFRTIDSPTQIHAKVADEVKAIFHEKFCGYYETLNQVESVELHGDEVLYRGIPTHAMSRDDILQIFSATHRSETVTGGIASHQLWTDDIAVFNPDQGRRSSQACSTTSDAAVATRYALENVSGASEEGWVIEVRPPKGATAALPFHNLPESVYETGFFFQEFTFGQLNPQHIIAVHRIKRERSGDIQVMETLRNPNYKKRSGDTSASFFTGRGRPYQLRRLGRKRIDVCFEGRRRIRTDRNAACTHHFGEESPVTVRSVTHSRDDQRLPLRARVVAALAKLPPQCGPIREQILMTLSQPWSYHDDGMLLRHICEAVCVEDNLTKSPRKALLRQGMNTVANLARSYTTALRASEELSGSSSSVEELETTDTVRFTKSCGATLLAAIGIFDSFLEEDGIRGAELTDFKTQLIQSSGDGQCAIPFYRAAYASTSRQNRERLHRILSSQAQWRRAAAHHTQTGPGQEPPRLME